MSTENEESCLPAPLAESPQESQKNSKISYTREFLLSLSELDVCKKLPSGFDASILSEFEDSSNSIPDRSGGLFTQSFRRGEYGSSPPTRGDLGHYSRGIHGRWDNRSAGLNDRDGESQSDWESGSGKRYGNQTRRSWQNPEHDGLLGSGALPRPSGSTAGPSAPRVRGNGPYQLNKSNEPYHPPRPYQAVPHSRINTTDLINEETFGSSDCSSEDRAEEERKRRASFELFRKEQQKAFQEKPNHFPDKHKENVDPDIATLLEVSEHDKELSDKFNGGEDVAPPASQSDYAKFPSPAQTPVPRPRVPPGFASTLMEKNLVTKSVIPLPASEVGDIGLEDNITQVQYDKKSVPHVDSRTDVDVCEKTVLGSSDVEISDQLVGVISPYKTSTLSKDYEGLGEDEGTDRDTGKVPGHEIMSATGQEHSTSILDKLFGHALTENSGGFSGLIKYNDAKTDDNGDDILFQSSKFNHWFLEEGEKEPIHNLSSGKPKDLLSLIVSGEKGGSHVLDAKPPIFPSKSNELQQFIATPAISANSDTTPRVLTCEDLEQSILSEINENNSSLQHSVQARSTLDAKSQHSEAEADNHASQHLLSLLQKGTSTTNPDVASSDNNNSREGNDENVSSEKNLTLETLFGATFMNELHSFEAPVSVQRGSIGSATRTDISKPHGFPISVADDGYFPSTISEYGSNRATPSNLMKETKSNNIQEHWLGFDVQQTKVGGELNAIGGLEDRTDGALDLRLPEEESLITMGDPVNSRYSMFMPVENATKAELFSSSNMPVDIVDKLAALNAVLKDKRSMVSGQDVAPSPHGLFNPMEPDIPYRNLQGNPSSPKFTHPQMNHGRPSIQPLDAHHTHMNPLINFMSPESINHPEPPPHHHFPSNMFHPSSMQHGLGGPTRFSPPSHHPMSQHIHNMPGNFPPPHLLQGLPRGAPLPPHHINHMAGYSRELNSMQGFPLSHRQPVYGGLEMRMPAPGVGVGGSNPPEAFEKIIEMELRANLKQMQSVTGAAAPNQGMYGHEVDMGFRYR